MLRFGNGECSQNSPCCQNACYVSVRELCADGSPSTRRPSLSRLSGTFDDARSHRFSLSARLGSGLGVASASPVAPPVSSTSFSTAVHPRSIPGSPLFTTDTPYQQVPGPIGHHDTTTVMVTPAKIIAPVGSEVIVQAAVCGQDHTLMAGEKVEWSIAPNSVGYFVQAGETGPLDWMHHVGYRTRKVDNTFAVSATSPKFIMLNRGTPTPDDDVPILRGQAWTTMSSPVEGTSFVTAVAPTCTVGTARKQTATIYWVDANGPSRRRRSTRPARGMPSRRSLVASHRTIARWPATACVIEIAGGPPAGFAPDGVQIIEVTTNSLGQATVEIFQTQPQAGTNIINITIIRPADWPGGDGTPLVVGSGTTQKTWTTTTAGGLSIDKSGPTEAAVGGTITYRIVVRNPSDLTARGLVVTDAIPDRPDVPRQHAAGARQRHDAHLEPRRSGRRSIAADRTEFPSRSSRPS